MVRLDVKWLEDMRNACFHQTAFNPLYAVAIADAMNSSRLLTQEATLNAVCSCDSFLGNHLLYSDRLKADTVLEVLPG